MCSMVPVPDEADEDARRCVRERSELISERIGLTNRIGAILATLGVSDYNPLLRNRGRRLAELRTALGEPLPANAHAKLKRLLARLELVLTQIAELERERDAVVETEASDGASTHFYRSVIRASNEFESQMSHLFASLPARIGDSGY